MVNLQITGGSFISSSECESLFKGLHYNFESPADLKKKIFDEEWEKGSWSDFRRFSPFARIFTLSVGLALRDSGISFLPEKSIGILTADDFEHESDQISYFQDFVEGGRTLGRSSLFVHTLPTSSAVDASVCLGLRGPLLYLRDENDIWGGLLETAEDFITDGNAEIMILAYRKDDNLVCLVVSYSENSNLRFDTRLTPEMIFETARKYKKLKINENSPGI